MQLVINTFGASLRRRGERFLVRAKDREIGLSAHEVQGILIATGISITTDALQLAAEHNIDVVLLDKFGDPYGRFWQNRMGSTAAIRPRQLEAAEGPEGLALVRGWVETKLRHQVEFLDELARRRPDSESDFSAAQAGIRDRLTNKTSRPRWTTSAKFIATFHSSRDRTGLGVRDNQQLARPRFALRTADADRRSEVYRCR